MPECAYCGKKISLPFKCKFCGQEFCMEHRLPENHDCPKLKEFKEKSKEDINMIYEPFREKSITHSGKSGRKIYVNLQQYMPKWATNFLLLLLIIFSFIGFKNPAFFNFFSLDPMKAISQPWRLITSIFLHVNFWHLFVNAFVLFIFGKELERRTGKLKFLEIFFVSGIAAGIGYSLFSLYTTSIPAVGASGAIYGILGALVFLAPEIRVFIMFIPIPMKLIYAILLFIAWDLLLRAFGAPIANTAHLAGLITGLIYGYFLRKKSAIYRRFNLY